MEALAARWNQAWEARETSCNKPSMKDPRGRLTYARPASDEHGPQHREPPMQVGCVRQLDKKHAISDAVVFASRPWWEISRLLLGDPCQLQGGASRPSPQLNFIPPSVSNPASQHPSIRWLLSRAQEVACGAAEYECHPSLNP